MTQIVTRIIFRQTFIEFDNIPSTVYHLEACHPVACHAVLDHFDTAGVGGYIAANLTGPRGGKIYRIK